MKKVILILITIPFLGIAQNTKTDKVINQVGVAATVAGGVIGLFKKKNKDNTDNKSETKTDNKNTTNNNSNGTFSVNANPEDIVANIYKCTYKKMEKSYPGEEDRFLCVWKPTTAELKQKDYDINAKIMFAVIVDTVLAFKQNGIDNTVIIIAFKDYSTDENISFYCADCSSKGVIRFQAAEGKMKPISYYKLEPEANIYDGGNKSAILKLDEDNIFYSVPSYEEYGGGGNNYESIFSLSGELLFSYKSNGFWGGAGERYAENSSSEIEMKIDKANKTITLVENSFYTTKKGSKKTKEIVGTYQYGNGTITEIKQPVATKKTTTKKK